MSSHKSSNSLLPVQYGGHQFRMFCDARGMPWFVAKDVCDIVGVANVSDAVSRLDEDEKGFVLCDTPGGPQTLLTVNEYGLYELTLGGRKKEAKAFRRTVTHEILPSLHRTGTYTMPGRIPPAPSPHLPPPPRYVLQERAHVSEYLLAVWTTLRQAEHPLSNADIMRTAHLKAAVTRKWTRYLLHIGVLDMYETYPHHLFAIAPQADKRHAGYYQRLERLASIMEHRQQRLWK